MASKAIGFLNFKFGADLGGFDRAMKKAQKNLKRFGKNIERTGKNLTTGLTLPIAAFGAVSLKAFDEQQKAIAQVEAGIKSTGMAAGFTSEELQKMASDLQKNTLFGDEEILKGATAQLLTFTNITGEQFAKTQEVALDLATRLDGDLKGASIMLGKALNDPIANLSALSRAGIQFSTEQKTLIKSLVETGDIAKAQTIILEELEKQYGGSAEAARQAGLGPVEALKNQFSDLTEQIGERLLPVVTKIATFLVGLMQRFDGLSERTKDFIVTIGLIVAAIGPFLIVVGKISLGLSALIPVFKSVGVLIMRTLIPAFKKLFVVMMANPILATIGLLTALGVAIHSYISSSKNAKTAAQKQAEEERILNAELREREKNLRNIAAIDYNLEVTELKMKGASDAEIQLKAVNFQLNNNKEQLKKLETGTIAYKIVERQVNSLLQQKVDLEKKIEKATKKRNKGTQELTNTTNELTESTEAYDKSLDPLLKNIENFKELGMSFGPQFDENFIKPITKLTQEQKIAQSGFQMFGDVLTSSLDDALSSQQKFFPIFIANIKKAIQSLLVQLAVMTLISSIMPASLGGIGKAAFTKKGLLGNLGSLMGFAEGGLVTGPTVGLIGEGIGTTASNPEVIAPLDKLKNFIGGGSQNVIVEGVIKGNDIFLSNRNTGTNRQRSV
jgi:Tfp pilus assembly protein PilX